MIDYIFYESEKLQLDADLELICKKTIGPKGLPHQMYPSDHMSLLARFSFKDNKMKVA